MANSNLALLIDGDNASSKIIAGLLVEIANYGTASVRRIYGDWTSPNMNSWKKCLLDHSITPIQQFAYTSGKNATDGAIRRYTNTGMLMTGLLTQWIFSTLAASQVSVSVSSDSDFTRLASRIREQGVTVYGFGERRTPSPFVSACDRFIYVDVLRAAPVDMAEPSVPGELSKSGQRSVPVREQREQRERPLSGRPIDSDARANIVLAIRNSREYENGWVNLAEVGGLLNKLAPNLNARNYGYERLREFIEASGLSTSCSNRWVINLRLPWSA
ncbi:uncharacterized protein RSE6_14637 [Rhynchosporium secalis]|uniref:HTH OST-type domain-containing protein n=1 Tax=Rhynchosporium secalis TaxID=38038 RepID=A0A1E1MVS4_RHYSE|nr:uncharacterized protein RSE6_14637 [Rhynchosporium secalis]